MRIIAIKLVQIVATVFAAEFVAGVVHWFEDAYVRESTPLIGKFVGRPNTVHHHYPRYMTRHNWWHYCTTTNLLNPILDTLRFWDGLEWILAKTTRLNRRPDTSVRGFGPGPAWLDEFRRMPALAKR